MGFGFNLGMIFIVMPLTLILAVLWGTSKKELFANSLLTMWGGIILLVIFSLTVQYFSKKIVLEKDDYYGHYIIDRSYFPGKQADWQYNHFRFEIKTDNTLSLYETEEEKIIKTWQGRIETISPYESARLVLKVDSPTHHILNENPTTYRAWRSFYLVFKSKKFNNMFFKKGEWKPIESN
jgi:hypothetical protein